MKGKIELKGMKFHSKTGCLESEKTLGNDMVVDFSCCCDIAAAAASDNLEDTIDYSRIYTLVAEQMHKECNLMENDAGRIAAAIEKEFPYLEHFTVRVSKKNPPLGGEVEWSSVSVEK